VLTCEAVVLPWYKMGKESLWTDAHHKDAKTQLQEYLQAKQLPLPTYTVLQTWGDQHHPIFQICCEIAILEVKAIGEAPSRKRAEQAAAEALLQQLGVESSD
jgi:ribonuclease-3